MTEPPTEVEGRIFISYRREDSAYPAGWLFDRLAERFGAERIFKDVDSIELGDDFVEEIEDAVGQTDVLLALIGERWLTVADEQGSRRLDDPEDFVRLEIEAALRRKVRVIPILVEGASMPSEEQLPPSLTPLARRQALELSPARFSSDTSRLLAVLERGLAEARAAEAPTRIERAPPPAGPSGAPGWRQRLGQPPVVIGVLIAVVLALIVGGVLLLSGGPDEPAAAPTETEDAAVQPRRVNGRIAYVSDESGNEEIWSVGPDGSDSTQLTFGFDEARRPDWSPDGTKVVFASDQDNETGDLDLWVLDTEDGNVRRLTRDPTSDGAPDWSPDGTEIAFSRGEPGEDRKDIWILDVESREARQATDDPADDDAPDWSTTNRIAFESNRDGPDVDIFTLDSTGVESDVRQITSNTWDDLVPDWSPDGRRIAYRSNPDGESSFFDIYTIEAAGGQPQRLTDTSATDNRPSWSPDGTLIAFDSESDGQTDILVVPSNGGEPEPLVSGPGNQEAPGWGVAP